MNAVVLIGRLTRDPVVRYTSGTQNAVASFTIAVNRPFSKEKIADFLRIVVFGMQAENCEHFLTKGCLVEIQGRIQTGSYKTQTGETRYTTDIVAERVEFLEWAKKDGSGAGGGQTDADIPEGFEALTDDDMPF